MQNENNRIFLSKPMSRKIQVLDKIKGYCPICKKETKHDIVYVFRKERIPIILVVINTIRRYPDFYAKICENCNTILTVFSKTQASYLKDKHERSFWGKHKKSTESEPKGVEIRFLTNHKGKSLNIDSGVQYERNQTFKRNHKGDTGLRKD